MKREFLSLIPIVMLSSCGTIDQVPLVYVSTVRVGVSAETGTTSTPGAKVILGVDATDAAFVPVEAGRHCQRSQNVACDNTDYPIWAVHGDNNISPADLLLAAQAMTTRLQSDTSSVGELQSALAAAQQAQFEAQAQANLLETDKKSLAALQAAAAAAATPAPAAGAAGISAAVPPPDPETVKLNDAIAARQGAPATLAARNADLDAARERLKRGMATLAQTRSDLDALLARSPDSVGKRSDALSVFGSFDTDAHAGTDGNNPGGGIVLGKSFSTGVAAQLLTEGLSRAAGAKEASHCLEVAFKFTVEADRSAAILACQTRHN